MPSIHPLLIYIVKRAKPECLQSFTSAYNARRNLQWREYESET
jgi:hypothetical protein